MPDVWGLKGEIINDLGYSDNFIFSLRSSVVIFVYIIGGMVGLYLLYRMMIKNIRDCRRTSYKIKSFVFLNLPIRFLMQTFLCFMLAALYNIKYGTFGNLEEILGMSISILVVLVYSSLLFVVIWFMLHNRKKLRRVKYVHTVGTLYQEVRTSTVGALLYTEIYLCTRFFLAVIIVLFANHPSFQIAPVAFLTTLQAFYAF